jgi:hypothetical protein
VDDTNSDTNFNVCPQNVGANQCQGHDLAFDYTSQAYFPSQDSKSIGISHGSTSWSSSQFQITINAETNPVWSVLNNDFGTSPLYAVIIGTSNGELSANNVQANYANTASYVTGCSSSTNVTLL